MPGDGIFLAVTHIFDHEFTRLWVSPDTAVQQDVGKALIHKVCLIAGIAHFNDAWGDGILYQSPSSS